MKRMIVNENCAMNRMIVNEKCAMNRMIAYVLARCAAFAILVKIAVTWVGVFMCGAASAASHGAGKFMVVNLESGAVVYLESTPEGGWDVGEYKGTKMAFVRIEPGTFMQCSDDGTSGREVTITRPYYMGILPVTHKQLRTLAGASYRLGRLCYAFNDDVAYHTARGGASLVGMNGYSYPDKYVLSATLPYRGIRLGELHLSYTYGGYMELLQRTMRSSVDRNVDEASPLGVLRARTGCDKFDLPTEAQLEMARKSVIWHGSTLCLDYWRPQLGIGAVSDPLEVPPSDPAGFRVQNIAFACVGEAGRCSSVDVSPYTRFCLSEAE